METNEAEIDAVVLKSWVWSDSQYIVAVALFAAIREKGYANDAILASLNRLIKAGRVCTVRIPYSGGAYVRC